MQDLNNVVKSLFVAQIISKVWNSSGGLGEDFHPFLYCNTGKVQVIYETTLSKIGLQIGERFKIGDEILDIIDRYMDTDGDIIYVTSLMVYIEDEESKKIFEQKKAESERIQIGEEQTLKELRKELGIEKEMVEEWVVEQNKTKIKKDKNMNWIQRLLYDWFGE